MSAEHTFSRRDALKAAGLTLVALPFMQSREHVFAAESRNEGTFFQSEFYPYSLTHPQKWEHTQSWWGNDNDSTYYDIDVFTHPSTTEIPKSIMQVFARPTEVVGTITTYQEDRIIELRERFKADDKRFASYYEGRNLFNFTSDDTQNVGEHEALTLEGSIPLTVIEGTDLHFIMKIFEANDHIWEINFTTPLDPHIREENEHTLKKVLSTFQIGGK